MVDAFCEEVDGKDENVEDKGDDKDNIVDKDDNKHHNGGKNYDYEQEEDA
jgi:hypothetical protein